MLLFGVESRNFQERMFRYSEQTDLRATSTLYSVPTNLFVMKSRKERTSSRSASLEYGKPDDRASRCSTTTLSLLDALRRAALKQYKATALNKYSLRFYRRHPWRLSRFIAVRKLLYRMNAPPYHSHRLIEKLRDDRQQGRKADKDQTPAVYSAYWLDVVRQLCRRCLSRRSLAFPSALSI